MTKEKKYSTLPASEKAPVIQQWLAEHKATRSVRIPAS